MSFFWKSRQVETVYVYRPLGMSTARAYPSVRNPKLRTEENYPVKEALPRGLYTCGFSSELLVTSSVSI